MYCIVCIVCIVIVFDVMNFFNMAGVPIVTVTITGANGNTYNVMSGGTFTITCMLSCPTNANVTWRQNDMIISSSLPTPMTASDFTVDYQTNGDGEVFQSVLTRNMAQPSDTAVYQCGVTVQNIQSNDSANIFVYGKCLL